MNQFGSRGVLGNNVLQITAGNLPHFISSPHDRGKLLGVMFLAPRAMTNKDGEKAGEPVGFVRSGRFQVTPKGFRPHIDTKDGL